MKYFIGIDAGGSKTDCVLTDENLNIINTVKGEGFNLTTYGVEKAAEITVNLIPVLLKSISYPDVSISIGAAGAGRSNLRESLKNLLTSKLKTAGQIEVYTDAEAAYAASFPEGNGFILIAGTGSIIFGKNKQGQYLRAGGYGKLIDKGSGYSLGLKAFAHTSSVLDKLISEDSLSREICNKYSIDSTEKLISLINNPDFNIADAAITVIAQAENKIPSAVNIIIQESEELLKLVTSISNQSGSDEFRLSFNGSLIANKNCYSELLKDKIAESFPHIEIITPKFSPAIGSIILSRQEKG